MLKLKNPKRKMTSKKNKLRGYIRERITSILQEAEEEDVDVDVKKKMLMLMLKKMLM